MINYKHNICDVLLIYHHFASAILNSTPSITYLYIVLVSGVGSLDIYRVLPISLSKKNCTFL